MRLVSRAAARTVFRSAFAGLLLLLVSCGPRIPDADGDAGAGADAGPPPKPRCLPSADASGLPRSIDAAVALINGLPRPTSIACFVQSLERPLRLYATEGIVSAQPADGRRSPRIFLFSGPLILSIVPSGGGASVLEFGELRDPLHSIKAELPFPVLSPVSPEAPYAHVIRSESGTNCGLCHAQEEVAFTVGTSPAYASVALRPHPRERVPLHEVRREALSCDPVAEPDRCAILDAIFGFGEVLSHDFPLEMPTFYE